MDILLENLTILEDLLVREFRACQALHELTKEERLILTGQDICGLLTLVEHKEAVLDELSQLGDRRRMVLPQLAKIVGLPPQASSLVDVLDAIDNEYCDRLKRLHEGIIALLGGIRNITYSNRALAIAGLERVDAVQSFLIDLFHPLAN